MSLLSVGWSDVMWRQEDNIETRQWCHGLVIDGGNIWLLCQYCGDKNTILRRGNGVMASS